MTLGGDSYFLIKWTKELDGEVRHNSLHSVVTWPLRKAHLLQKNSQLGSLYYTDTI